MRLLPRGAGRDHADRPHAVAAQQVDRGGVEAVSREVDEGGLRLTGGGGGEQVVDVDAPLEDHHPGAGPERVHRAGLPAGSAAGDEDDGRAHPRTATETSGSVRLPSSP